MKDRKECADLFGIVDHETIVQLAHLIHALGWPIHKSIDAWCTAPPQPGDLVVEMSKMRHDPDRVGLFERQIGDSVQIVVQLEPRRTCTWTNASFIRLPKNDEQRREALGR